MGKKKLPSKNACPAAQCYSRDLNRRLFLAGAPAASHAPPLYTKLANQACAENAPLKTEGPYRSVPLNSSDRKEEAHTLSAKSDYTPEEWRILEQAPVFVAFATLAADMSGPIGLVKEMEALSQALEERNLPSDADPAHELIAAVAADLRATQSSGQGWGMVLGEGGDPDSEQDQEHPSAVPGSGLDFSSPEKVKEPALAACRAAAELLTRKTTAAEAEAFGRWALTVGRRVAEAAKEGGFLGIGGTLVSEKERTTLDELDVALGVQR
jgi:hypothetical protein